MVRSERSKEGGRGGGGGGAGIRVMVFGSSLGGSGVIVTCGSVEQRLEELQELENSWANSSSVSSSPGNAKVPEDLSELESCRVLP